MRGRKAADAVAELIDIGAVKGRFVPEGLIVIGETGGHDFEAGGADGNPHAGHDRSERDQPRI